MGAGSKIMWSEGLTLGPQHFQRQDLYHETRLQRMAAALSPHFWGVQSVQWNLEALRHNLLSAETLSIIFPDGEIYEAPGTDLLPEPVDLARLPADVQTFTFHLALSGLKAHGGNADAGGRFVRFETETLDLFSDAVAIEVPYLKKPARLVLQDAAPATHSSIAVIQVRRTTQGGFEMEPGFIPPCVAIGAVPLFGRIVEDLISALTAKMLSLQGLHRKADSGAYQVAAANISSWWMLNMVSTANALLMHAARSPGQHPEALYEKLLAAAAGLMTFSDRYQTADLPAYRHAALGGVFTTLDAMLRDLLSTVIAASYVVIALVAEPERRAFFRAILDPAMVTRESQLCLAVSADLPALELVAAVPMKLKMAAPDDLDRIVMSALPGVPLTHMPQVPAAIPVRPGTYYFSLSAKSPLYDNALKAAALSLYAPDGIPGLKTELILIAA